MRSVIRMIPTPVRTAARRILFAGSRFYCPCCGNGARAFHTTGYIPRPHARCPFCNSLERHRLLWRYLEEKTPFFQTVRFDTIVGTFALPSWGGNRDYAGWHMLGLEHQPRFQAPFGEYDADANRRK